MNWLYAKIRSLRQVRRKPQSRWRRYLKRLEWCLAGIAVVYFAVGSFPQLLFAHRLEHGVFTVYSTREIPGSLAAVLERAEKLLAASELNDPECHYRVFLCNDHRLYAFLCPAARHAAASTRWLPENIVIANPDIVQDLAFSDQDQSWPDSSPYRSRHLSGTLAHEATHVLIRKRFGRLKEMGLPAWTCEGICDFVAEDSHFDRAKGLEMLRRGVDDPSGWFSYFKYRMMIEYLVRKKGLSLAEIVAGEFDAAKVEQDLVAAIRAGEFS
jgi:hypothetical protein